MPLLDEIMLVKSHLLWLLSSRRWKMPDAEAVQVCGCNSDHRFTDGLPLIGHDECTIHVPNDLLHWGAEFVARGGVIVGVCLAVIKLPEDGLWVVIRVIRWLIRREGWRHLATRRGQLRC